VEKAYYRRAAFFHYARDRHPPGCLRKNPWLAVNIYQAFSQAKQITQAELFETAALRVGLPWVVSSALSAQEVLGPDIFPYGVKSSMKALQAAIRYSMEQHIAVREISVEEMFRGHDGRSEDVIVPAGAKHGAHCGGIFQEPRRTNRHFGPSAQSARAALESGVFEIGGLRNARRAPRRLRSRWPQDNAFVAITGASATAATPKHVSGGAK